MRRTRKSRVPKCLSRSHVPEKDISMNLLNGFIAQGSKGEKLIVEMTGTQLDNLSKTALCKISDILSKLSGIKISRNILRRKDLIVKWFHDNEDKIEPFKYYVSVNFSQIKEN